MRDAGPTIRAVQMAPDAWSDLAKAFDDLSYRQLPAYVAEAAALDRATAEFVALRAGDELVGLCAFRVKKLPGLPVGVAYALHGPLGMRGGNYSWEIYSQCLSALGGHYSSERGLVLRIAPAYAAARDALAAEAAFARAGFGLTSQPRKRTIMLALDRDLAQIRKGLNGKWRNMLVQSERLPIEIVETVDPRDFALIAPMLSELEDRKQFRSAHNVAFFERVQRASSPWQRFKLHFAYLDGRILSGSLTSFAGDTAVLLLAASNEEGRRTRASNRIQWRLVEEAARAGLRWYDAGGIDPEANPGVYSFKKGLNGVELSEIGVFERASHPMVARSVALLETLYRRARALV